MVAFKTHSGSNEVFDRLMTRDEYEPEKPGTPFRLSFHDQNGGFPVKILPFATTSFTILRLQK